MVTGLGFEKYDKWSIIVTASQIKAEISMIIDLPTDLNCDYNKDDAKSIKRDIDHQHQHQHKKLVDYLALTLASAKEVSQ